MMGAPSRWLWRALRRPGARGWSWSLFTVLFLLSCSVQQSQCRRPEQEAGPPGAEVGWQAAGDGLVAQPTGWVVFFRLV